MALENAAIIFNNVQSIFLIDPSGSATQFITNFYSQTIQILNANQSDLLTQVICKLFNKNLFLTLCFFRLK